VLPKIKKSAHRRGVSVFKGLNFVASRPVSPDSPHFTVYLNDMVACHSCMKWYLN